MLVFSLTLPDTLHTPTSTFLYLFFAGPMTKQSNNLDSNVKHVCLTIMSTRTIAGWGDMSWKRRWAMRLWTLREWTGHQVQNFHLHLLYTLTWNWYVLIAFPQHLQVHERVCEWVKERVREIANAPTDIGVNIKVKLFFF